MAITDPNMLEEYRRKQAMHDKMSAIGSGNVFISPGGIHGMGDIFQHMPPGYEFPTTPQTMLYHASVEKAENGYILKVTHKQGEQPKIFVAANTEELQRVFIAAIVAERVGK